MATKSQIFTDNWKKIVKSSKKNFFEFSGTLLELLCYKTDVGPIPRGIEIAFPPPEYVNNSNWKKDIVGCYWCHNNYTSFQPMCCSRLCLYLLYEWCIERVEVISGQKLCKLPSCNSSVKSGTIFVCCSRNHMNEYKQLFQEFSNSKIKEIQNFPRWYDRDLNAKVPKQQPIIRNSTMKNSTLPKPSPLPNMDLLPKIKEHLIYDTDVGPIPRSSKNEEHLRSRFSSSRNWLSEIPGCYQCLKTVKEKKEFLCSKTCYIIFNEWCRLKVSEYTNEEYCKYPGCARKAIGNMFCGKDHKRKIKKKYPYLNTEDCLSKVDQGPHWYTRDDPQFPSKQCKIESSSRKPNVLQIIRKESVFSCMLTKFLFERCDVGPIPRKLFELIPDIYSQGGLKNGNFNAIIPGCYWCCESNQSIRGIACSNLCFFLFNEWCHKKYQQFNSKRLCKFLHCETTVSFGKDCCKKEHSDWYNDTFVTKYYPHLKSTNYALGPKWYLDTASNHIDFYNREDPFYEFTNFFVCPILIIDNNSWPTTEHYFQAQKFVGTPHCEFIRRLNTPRDSFEYARRPKVQTWIRADWGRVKEFVMLKALEEKFNQNEHLKDLLIRTGDKKLYEHTNNDRFWGDGGDRKGQNKLGMLLMQVRFELHGRERFLPGFLSYLTLDGRNDQTHSDINKRQDLTGNNNVVLNSHYQTVSDQYPAYPHGATPYLSTMQYSPYNNYSPTSNQFQMQSQMCTAGNNNPFGPQFQRYCFKPEAFEPTNPFAKM